MKKLLQFIAQPGVPYPIGAVAHALVGVVTGFGAWLASK